MPIFASAITAILPAIVNPFVVYGGMRLCIRSKENIS
jgi:hypothetical protein